MVDYYLFSIFLSSVKGNLVRGQNTMTELFQEYIYVEKHQRYIYWPERTNTAMIKIGKEGTEHQR